MVDHVRQTVSISRARRIVELDEKLHRVTSAREFLQTTHKDRPLDIRFDSVGANLWNSIKSALGWDNAKAVAFFTTCVREELVVRERQLRVALDRETTAEDQYDIEDVASER